MKNLDIPNPNGLTKSNQYPVLKEVAGSEEHLDNEASIPNGGQNYRYYEKGKYEHVGVITNHSTCIRKQDSGRYVATAIGIDKGGTYSVNTPIPYTELVENTRFPCGDYHLVVGNQFNVNIGSGGYVVNNQGNLLFSSGGRSTITSTHDMNFSTPDNINLKSGSCLDISGNTMRLSTPNQVMVDANLGVAKNAIIHGTAYIDGELYTNHITCPKEIQYTEGGMGSFGQIVPSHESGSMIIGYADVSYIKRLLESNGISWGDAPDKVPVLALSNSATSLASDIGFNSAVNPTNSIFMYPHEHPFGNVPIQFADGNPSMRNEAASKLNGGEINPAKSIVHGVKTDSDLITS